jgi:methionyl aminopeptidase
MTIETEQDVAALKRIGKIVSYVLQEMLDAAEPGMTTRELDSFGALAGAAWCPICPEAHL